MVREGRVFINPAGRPAYGGNYRVKACAVGAQVRSASSGTTINVHAGHGFSVGNKFIVGTDIERYREVTAVSSQQLEVDAAVSVANHELLINIGGDSGSTGGPNFDGTAVQIYTDMAYQDAPADATVTADSVGRYRYWHKGVPRWELVLALGTPVAVYMDTGQQADEDQTSYQVRYAHLFATGGTGTAADPWVTAGSNAVQAAIDDILLESTTKGGIVRCVAGVYDLGSDDGAVTIDAVSESLEGWTIEGYGPGTTSDDSTQGGTVFLYSGSGSAFKLGDFTNNNTLAFSKLRNFKLLQTGSDGSGIGLLLRLFRHGVIEDVLVEDFAYGAALASVSDFNTFRRFRTRDCRTAGAYVGYTTGMPTINGQCNANLFQECDIMNLSRLNGYTNYGIFIDTDSVNTVVYGNCRFHNFDTNQSAAILCRQSNGLTVNGCYFEGNYFGVTYQSNDASDFLGFTCSDNYITQTPGGVAIRTNAGSTGLLSGVVISRNHITNPSNTGVYTGATGIVVHNNARNAVLIGNEYVNMGTDVTVGGASATYVRIEDGATVTTGAATIGGAATITGNLTLTAGTVTGDIATTGNITSGGHIQGLLQTYTISSATPTIPHGGRHMIDITCNFGGANAPTLAAPSSNDGKLLILRCVALTAGTFSIADTGNVDLSAAWTPNAGDTLTLVASGVIWYELARSAN